MNNTDDFIAILAMLGFALGLTSFIGVIVLAIQVFP
jgi:hypothetical protein